jgi:aspartate aminotransferase
MHDRLVLCGSASKSYAMTGWRCGWLAGPRAVTAAGSALQSHETSNASSITQKAAVAALTGPQQCVADMLAEYEARRDQLMMWLGEEPRFAASVPHGAFYLFPGIHPFLSANGCRSSLEFADRLLETEHVVLTAGEAFDAPGYLRISYAASPDRIREGVTRLIRFARSLT